MNNIDHFNLRNFDLNLLVAFDSLMQERSVTLAAERLRIQQPTMSHTLSVLRLLFADELFVRVKQRLQPTERALALRDPIRMTLSQVQETLLRRDTFDPALAERTFCLGLTNGLEVLLLPQLNTRLRQEAPGIRLIARAVDAEDSAEMIEEGEIDLFVGCNIRPEPWLRSKLLFEETLTCCFNPRRLPAGVPIGLKTYLDTPHVSISVRGNLEGCLEGPLAQVGAKLNVVAAGPSCLSALAMASEGPVLATLPTHLADYYAPLFGLLTSPVPLPFSPIPVTMAWHVCADRELGGDWLRECISSFFVGVSDPATDRKPRPVAGACSPREIGADLPRRAADTAVTRPTSGRRPKGVRLPKSRPLNASTNK